MKIQSHTILDMEAIYFHFQHLENKKKKTGKSNLKSTNRTKRLFSCQWIRENGIPNWFRLLVFCGENESALLSWIVCRCEKMACFSRITYQDILTFSLAEQVRISFFNKSMFCTPLIILTRVWMNHQAWSQKNLLFYDDFVRK